jgi:hypothetical protein
MEPSDHGVDDEVGIGETVATPDTTIAAVLADRTEMLMTIEGQAKPLIGAAVDGRGLRQVLELRPDLLLLRICAIDADDGIAAYHLLALAMNLRLLQPVISTRISGERQSRAWRSARLVIGWFALCLFATAAFALDPQKSITQFVHTAWTEKDGAPADIEAITQTKDGYLWLGMLALSEIWIVLTGADQPQGTILLATLGVALAFLGPGALSIDARLFGRKRLDIQGRGSCPYSLQRGVRTPLRG